MERLHILCEYIAIFLFLLSRYIKKETFRKAFILNNTFNLPFFRTFLLFCIRIGRKSQKFGKITENRGIFNFHRHLATERFVRVTKPTFVCILRLYLKSDVDRHPLLRPCDYWHDWRRRRARVATTTTFDSPDYDLTF